MDVQVKLLRAIQERQIQPVGAEKSQKVDIRIIAATNLDLQERISMGEFRKDLFYRLSVIPLFIPPLRERPEDIPALVSHFFKKFNAPADVHFHKDTLAAMGAYTWPGNIREMQNVVERCIILRKGAVIHRDDLNLPGTTSLPDGLNPVIPDEGISLEEVEKAYVVNALKKAGQNRSKAARLLKIPRHVLLYRLEKYGLILE